MRYLSKICLALLLLISSTAFGQFVMKNTINVKTEIATGDSKLMFSATSLFLESVIMEITTLEIIEYNNILSRHNLNNTTANNYPKYLKTIPNSLTILNSKIKHLHGVSHLPKVNQFRGTAPIHLMPEKYPQVVSAVPSKLNLNVLKPKAFGSKFSF